jgi:hypothetical protein
MSRSGGAGLVGGGSGYGLSMRPSEVKVLERDNFGQAKKVEINGEERYICTDAFLGDSPTKRAASRDRNPSSMRWEDRKANRLT